MAKVVKPNTREKALITAILKTKYPQMFKPGWGKVKKKKGVLKNYAKQTGSPSFTGASGNDLKELQKRFGKK